MGNMILAFDDDTEKLLRRMAKNKYGGKKGALTIVVKDALHKYNDDDYEKQRQEFMGMLKKGLNLGGYKMYKHRSEIYD